MLSSPHLHNKIRCKKDAHIQKHNYTWYTKTDNLQRKKKTQEQKLARTKHMKKRV